jgi:hypothetical protein
MTKPGIMTLIHWSLVLGHSVVTSSAKWDR